MGQNLQPVSKAPPFCSDVQVRAHRATHRSRPSTSRNLTLFSQSATSSVPSMTPSRVLVNVVAAESSQPRTRLNFKGLPYWSYFIMVDTFSVAGHRGGSSTGTRQKWQDNHSCAARDLLETRCAAHTRIGQSIRVLRQRNADMAAADNAVR